MFSKMSLISKISTILFLILITNILNSQEFAIIPKMTGWVVDTTGTLSQQEKNELKQKLETFKKEKGSQIAVLIIPTTKPETIEGYCLRVAEAWKVGRSGADDGVILCVAKNDRKLRIEVGYGAEAVVPDARAKQIISGIIVPNFKADLFYVGIDEGVNALILLLSGEDFVITVDGEEQSSELEEVEDQENTFIGLMTIFGIFAFIFHFAIPDKYLWKIGSGGAGLSFIVSIFLIGFFQALVVAGAFFLVTMFGMEILWIFLMTAGRGGSSSGGSSFGGGSFSGGGGGSFGGGGASGSW